MAESIVITFNNIDGLILNTMNTEISSNIEIKMNEEDLAKLIANNIKSGISIMGVTGTY